MTQLHLHGMHPESVWLDLNHHCPDGMNTMHAVVQPDLNGDPPVCTVFYNGLPVIVTDEIAQIPQHLTYGGETHMMSSGMPGHGEAVLMFALQIGVFSYNMTEDSEYQKMLDQILARPADTVSILFNDWTENYLDDGHATCFFLDELRERYEAALAR